MGGPAEEKGGRVDTESACPDCGALVSFGSELCPACGIPIIWEEAGYECPQCGALLSEDAVQCAECGLSFAPPERPPMPEVVTPKQAAAEVAAPGHAVVGAGEPVEAPSEVSGPVARPPGPVEAVGHAYEVVDERGGGVRGEGLVDGRGLTDGPGHAVAGPDDGKGLVNGTGMTNGSGLSGGGMVNGRGLVNGTGMTNGKGLTNGSGFTNGGGFTNGSGLTNGLGMTNGKGLTNGTGMTDGRGMTNGMGATNGLGPRLPRRLSRRHRDRTPMLVAVFFALLLVALALVWYSVPVKPSRINVDGKFGDWKDVYVYGDTRDEPVPSNADVDIKEWAVDVTDDELSAEVRVAGAMLGGRDGGIDSLYVFIDSDRNASTGYIVNGIGADYLVDVTGWNGTVRTAALKAWAGPKGESLVRLDLSKFEGAGAVEAAAATDRLELKVPTTSLKNLGEDRLVRLLVYMTDNGGSEDWADTAVNQRGPALEVRQTQGAAVGKDVNLTLALFAHRGPVDLTSLTVHYLGDGARGSASAPGAQATSSGGEQVTLLFSPPMRVWTASPSNLLITNVLGGIGTSRPVILTSDDVKVAGTAEPYVVQPPTWDLTSVLQWSPGDIRIDGNFDDWRTLWSMGQGPLSDPTGDAVPGLGQAVAGPNIDITSYSSLLTPVPGRIDLACYVKTSGHILNGRLMQRQLRPGAPSPGGGGAAQPVPMYLEDRTTVYIDVDPGTVPTGYRVGGIGADYRIVIRGKSGSVLDGGGVLQTYQLNGWVDKQQARVPVGADWDELETKVALSLLGLAPGSNASTYIETTDWSGAHDGAQATARAAPADRLYASEQSVAPTSAQRGERDVPVLRIALENRDARPVEVTAVSGLLLGTVPPGDIGAVRAWTGPMGTADFDAGTLTLISSGSSWEGTGFTLALPSPLLLGPGTACTVFVTVDVSATATTLNWFDVWVLNVQGLGTPAEVVYGQVHDSYKLVRVWNEGGGRTLPDNIIINEVENGSPDWIELYNPTGSNINIQDWYVLQRHIGKLDVTLVTFGDVDVAAGAYYTVDLTTDVSYSTTLWTLYLEDSGDADVDIIPLPSSWVSSGDSWARYKDANGDPYYSQQGGADWYTSSSPTQGDSNDKTIPEFKDVLAPVLGTVVLFALVRRTRGAGKRDE